MFASPFRLQCELATAARLALSHWHERATPRPCPLTTPRAPHSSTLPVLQPHGVLHARSRSRCHVARLAGVHATWFHPLGLLPRAASLVGAVRGDGRTSPLVNKDDNKRIRARRSNRPCGPARVQQCIRVDKHSRRSHRTHRAVRRAASPPRCHQTSQPFTRCTTHKSHKEPKQTPCSRDPRMPRTTNVNTPRPTDPPSPQRVKNAGYPARTPQLPIPPTPAHFVVIN